jgi:hypothetical protein
VQPENLRFGGGVADSVLHPLVLIALIIALALIFVLKRKYVIIPVLSMFFLVPLGQQLVIGGLHFFTSRIVILAIAIRIIVAVFSSTESVLGHGTDVLDKVFLLWAIFRALAGVLTFMQAGAVIYQLGFLLDAAGGYFALRYLIHDQEDVLRAIRVLAVITFALAGCMLYEQLTVVNVFGFLGGVREAPEVRAGLVRAVGPFQHELLAGAFGATTLPLFFLLWKTGQSRILAILGLLGSTGMTVASGSSTPLLAYVGGLLAICCFPLRRRMRLVRWGIVLAAIGLELVMKAHVWFLIQRMNLLGGSSGYQRAKLVDDFITHVSNWWLIGTKENQTWGYGTWDLLNQFVAEGEVGGLATFICFVALIVICFSKVGKARKAVEGNRTEEWYFWLLGSTLFSHVVAYWGVSYFDQTRFLWYALLSIIVVATAPYLAARTVPEPKGVLPYRRARFAYGTYSASSIKSRVLPSTRATFKSQLS